MWIDVKIPYEPKGKLAEAYNRAIVSSKAPWVLLLDHDVFLGLNPHWYDMCLETIKSVPINKVGMISCVTNGNVGRAQEPYIHDKTPDIDEQVLLAKAAYDKYGLTLQKAENKYLAGYFMLVNRKAWQHIRFQNQDKGVNKVDHDFCQRLLDGGWEIMVMKGLYVYHRKHVRKLKWNKD